MNKVSTEDMPYITDEHFFEREPADSFKYKLAEYMTKCCTKKEGPYGYTYGISAESILKMAEEELLKRGVVQKPTGWSEEQMEKPSKSLEEAAEEYTDNQIPTEYPDFFCTTDIKESFIAGAEWQKSQMLKDASEIQIVEDGRIELEGDPLPCLNPIILLPYPQFKPGDKVRVLVLKTEEEQI